MPEQRDVTAKGGTMRLGCYPLPASGRDPDHERLHIEQRGLCVVGGRRHRRGPGSRWKPSSTSATATDSS